MTSAMISEGNCGEPIYAQNAIILPTTPFAANIRRLQYGELVIIDGFVPFKAKDFNIDLEYLQEDATTDVLLHIGVNFTSGVIERNAKVNNVWEVAEKSKNVSDYIPQGQKFSCMILVRGQGFKIAFNGKHFAEFKHKAPYKYINRIHIDGSLDMDSICFQPGPGSSMLLSAAAMPLLPLDCDKEPEKPTTSTDPKTMQRLMSKDLEKFPMPYGPLVPYSEYIPGGFTSSRVLYISAVPQKFANDFVVNLLVGSAHSQKDIALHFKVLFPLKRVALNTLKKGKWGVEEQKNDKFPFTQGVTCDIMIVCEEERFKIAVNNCHYVEYRHRYKELNNIKGLQVSEGVKLLHIRLY